MENQGIRAKILAIRNRDPNATAAEIAAELGVSRQRVYQLFESLGLRAKIGYRPRPQKSISPQPRIVTGGVLTKINHTVAGTIGELLVAADLSARGYVVFFPIVRTAACDLISLNRDTGAVERIEVKCGTRITNKRIQKGIVDASKSDRIAIVITGEPVIYDPPFEGDNNGIKT